MLLFYHFCVLARFVASITSEIINDDSSVPAPWADIHEQAKTEPPAGLFSL